MEKREKKEMGKPNLLVNQNQNGGGAGQEHKRGKEEVMGELYEQGYFSMLVVLSLYT